MGTVGGTALSALGSANDEISLLQRIRSGERELFQDLIRPYERAAYVVANSVLRNPQDAEEVVQESMLKAFTHLDQLLEDQKFKSWLLQIVLNEARMRRRKDHKHLYESLDEPADETEEGDVMPRQFADWRQIPSEVLGRREIRESLTHALAQLPDGYREVFVMRDIEQIDLAETARLLGTSTSAVKTRSHRARLMLREQLAPLFQKTWIERLPFLKGKKPW